MPNRRRRSLPDGCANNVFTRLASDVERRDLTGAQTTNTSQYVKTLHGNARVVGETTLTPEQRERLRQNILDLLNDRGSMIILSLRFATGMTSTMQAQLQPPPVSSKNV